MSYRPLAGGARPDVVEPRTGERLHAREPYVVECLDQTALALDFGALGRPLGSEPLWARHKLPKRCQCQCPACADAPAHQNFQLPGTPTPQQLRATCCFGGGTPTGETTGEVPGELTLLGETHPLVLDVTLNKAEVYPFGHERFTLGLSLSGSLQRSDWGMTYGVDNGLVGDEVTLILETEAMRVED